jgi:hypothetical protein
MKSKEQVIFNISEEKFMYLHREERNKPNRVDLIDLNKKLNQTKKLNFYNNAKFIFLLSLCLGVFALISLKF